MELKRIRCEADVDWAMEEIDRLLEECGDNDDSPEACMLEALTLMVEAWALQNYPVVLPDPIDYLDTYLKARHLEPAALAPCLGGMENVEAVMSRRMPLDLGMIRKLVFRMGMPADVLIQPYSTPAADSGSLTASSPPADSAPPPTSSFPPPSS